jgi:RimJ/RimL family protein N-acetyltransferase
VLITKEKGSMLEAGFPWKLPHLTADADIGPVTAAVVNGSAVSICYCARLSPLGAEAGVETLDPMRGRGYATAAVAAWATAVRRQGLLALYSTTWENAASQRVAEKVGAVCYGEDWEIE